MPPVAVSGPKGGSQGAAAPAEEEAAGAAGGVGPVREIPAKGWGGGAGAIAAPSPGGPVAGGWSSEGEAGSGDTGPKRHYVD